MTRSIDHQIYLPGEGKIEACKFSTSPFSYLIPFAFLIDLDPKKDMLQQVELLITETVDRKLA